MPHQALSEIEIECVRRVLENPDVRSGLKKFFANHEVDYTEKARNQLNTIPENLHHQAKQLALARQYAAWAKAWGTIWPELETLIR